MSITLQVDGWSVQWETRREVQRGLLRADGGRPFKGLQVSLYDDGGDDEGRLIPIHHTESCTLQGNSRDHGGCSRPAHGLRSPGSQAAQCLLLPAGEPSTKLLWTTLRCFMVVAGDPQQSRVDEMGGHPQHKRLPSQGCLRRQHDHTHPRHSQVQLRV